MDIELLQTKIAAIRAALEVDITLLLANMRVGPGLYEISEELKALDPLGGTALISEAEESKSISYDRAAFCVQAAQLARIESNIEDIESMLEKTKAVNNSAECGWDKNAPIHERAAPLFECTCQVAAALVKH